MRISLFVSSNVLSGMDDEMNTAEVLRDEAKENRTREILELMRNSKTLEEAVEKVKALLNK